MFVFVRVYTMMKISDVRSISWGSTQHPVLFSDASVSKGRPIFRNSTKYKSTKLTNHSKFRLYPMKIKRKAVPAIILFG